MEWKLLNSYCYSSSSISCEWIGGAKLKLTRVDVQTILFFHWQKKKFQFVTCLCPPSYKQWNKIGVAIFYYKKSVTFTSIGDAENYAPFLSHSFGQSLFAMIWYRLPFLNIHVRSYKHKERFWLLLLLLHFIAFIYCYNKI